MKRGEWGGSRAAPLRAAHRGYEYQDIMAAIKLPDLLLGFLTSLTAEEKLYEGDPFDDLMAPTVHCDTRYCETEPPSR